MNRKELYALHDVYTPTGYMPNPEAHRANPRDLAHIETVVTALKYHCHQTWLDIGSWDGWLPFCVLHDYPSLMDVCMVEPVRSLSEGAKRYISSHKLSECQAITGWWLDDEIDPMRSFDLVTCFETLEHVPLDEVPMFIEKMELFCDKEIIISLPDQPCEKNPQHRWTPNTETINRLFGDKYDSGLQVDHKKFEGSNAPSNWFIRYRV